MTDTVHPLRLFSLPGPDRHACRTRLHVADYPGAPATARRAYREMRAAGMTADRARHLIVLLLNAGGRY